MSRIAALGIGEPYREVWRVAPNPSGKTDVSLAQAIVQRRTVEPATGRRSRAHVRPLTLRLVMLRPLPVEPACR